MLSFRMEVEDRHLQQLLARVPGLAQGLLVDVEDIAVEVSYNFV